MLISVGLEHIIDELLVLCMTCHQSCVYVHV
jgi:hypothetical protein